MKCECGSTSLVYFISPEGDISFLYDAETNTFQLDTLDYEIIGEYIVCQTCGNTWECSSEDDEDFPIISPE